MRRTYHTIEKKGKASARKLGEFLSKNGQFLLPMVDLIQQCRLACDELIEVAGRATVRAVLELSAQQVAVGTAASGEAAPRRDGLAWTSARPGGAERPEAVRRAAQEQSEVEIPAYTAMQKEPRLGARMLDILMRWVSTRQYRAVIPEMAETVGVSRSAVSRQAVEASEAELETDLLRSPSRW